MSGAIFVAFIFGSYLLAVLWWDTRRRATVETLAESRERRLRERDLDRMYFFLARPWFREYCIRQGRFFDGQSFPPDANNPLEIRWAADGMTRDGKPITVTELDSWEP